MTFLLRQREPFDGRAPPMLWFEAPDRATACVLARFYVSDFYYPRDWDLLECWLGGVVVHISTIRRK